MKISVIIPTYNEENTISETLCNLLHHHPHEIIVSDGGSTDKTINVVKNYSVTLVSGFKGRAQQMNEGARVASGDVLLFLHADTLLPPEGLHAVEQTLQDVNCQGGRFRMCFNGQSLLLRFFEFYTRFHFFSYGDQGFFMTRLLFDKLKGFCEDVPFEDIDMYKRMRKQTRLRIIQKAVITSARRFEGVGCMRQKWINLWLVALYYMGFDILPLKKKLYLDVR